MKTTKQGLKKMPTHYWMRKQSDNSIGKWEIVKVSDLNIHIINDPKHFGYKIVAIPNTPRVLIEKLKTK